MSGSFQLSVISYQLSVPTTKAGENENTLIEYSLGRWSDSEGTALIRAAPKIAIPRPLFHPRSRGGFGPDFLVKE